MIHTSLLWSIQEMINPRQNTHAAKLSGATLLAVAALAAACAQRVDAAPAKEAGTAPQCSQASHGRLLVRAGRDACAPTLDPAGRPASMGLLPTVCASSEEGYRIDALGRQDRCFAKRQTAGAAQ
jgi:hypothetical protein